MFPGPGNLRKSREPQQEPADLVREADAAWVLRAGTAGALNCPREHKQREAL